MPELIYSSERLGSGATIRLDSAEVVSVSLAQSGAIVRLNRGLFGAFLGPILYRETSIYKVASTGIMLALEYPNKTPLLPQFTSPVLASYANAVWHCSTAAAVTIAINQAAQKAEREDVIEAASLLAAFEDSKNWKQSDPQPLTCTAIFSDGESRETRLMAYEVATWPVDSNLLFERECRPYRIIQIVDRDGATLWSSSCLTKRAPY